MSTIPSSPTSATAWCHRHRHHHNSSSSPPSIPTRKSYHASPPSSNVTVQVFDLQDVLSQYQSQPELLKLILSSKVEEDKRRTEEAKLRAKELDLYLWHGPATNPNNAKYQQHKHMRNNSTSSNISSSSSSVSSISSSSARDLEGPQQHRRRLSSIQSNRSDTRAALVAPYPSPVHYHHRDDHQERRNSAAAAMVALAETTTTTTITTDSPSSSSTSSSSPPPAVTYFSSPSPSSPKSPHHPTSYPSPPSESAISCDGTDPRNSSSNSNSNSNSSSSSSNNSSSSSHRTTRRRREMQAITKIVETRDFPYQDGYFWKNNGNTTQRKTGCKSIYYKCSNSNKGCPVNKTVTERPNGEYVIKYRR